MAVEFLNTAEKDPQRLFIAQVEDLIDSAVEAAKDDNVTYSYRGFRVGAAGLFQLETGDEDVGFFALRRGNLKKRPNEPKYCAENRLLKQAKRKTRKMAGKLSLVGLVVVGTSDKGKIGEVTGIATPTLHPCADCRLEMHHDRIVDPETLVVTTGFDHERVQVFEFSRLKKLYDEFEEEVLTHENISDVRPQSNDCLRTYDNWLNDQGGQLRRSEIAQRALLGRSLYQ